MPALVAVAAPSSFHKEATDLIGRWHVWPFLWLIFVHVLASVLVPAPTSLLEEYTDLFTFWHVFLCLLL